MRGKEEERRREVEVEKREGKREGKRRGEGKGFETNPTPKCIRGTNCPEQEDKMLGLREDER